MSVLAQTSALASDSSVQLGHLLADDQFRLWACDNGLEDIGYPKTSYDGSIVGALPGRNLTWAFQRYKYQQAHPSRWGRAFRAGGGQFTGEVVEVRFLRPGTPLVGVHEGGRVVAMLAGRYFVSDASGTFRDLPPGPERDVPLAVAERNGPDGPRTMVERDLWEPGVAAELVIPRTPQEEASMRWRAEVSVVGEREALHASMLDKHGNDAYIAVVVEGLGRVEIPGSQRPIVLRRSGCVCEPDDSTHLLPRWGEDPDSPSSRASLCGHSYRFGGVEVVGADSDPW